MIIHICVHTPTLYVPRFFLMKKYCKNVMIIIVAMNNFACSIATLQSCK